MYSPGLGTSIIPPATVVKEVHFSYTWLIETFSSRMEEVGQSICSTRFSTGTNIQNEWHLTCYPRGRSKESEGYLSVYLYSVFHVTAKAVISIINSGKCEISNDTGVRAYVPSKGWGTPNLISRDDLFSRGSIFLPAGRLAICCDIVLYRDPNPPPSLPMKPIIKDFKKLLFSSEFSDVSLVVGEKEIQAHRNILSARSPVFSRMLNSEMMESSSREILIDDITEEALREMLSFVYTGQVPNIQVLAHQLYYAADKYQIDELIVICEDSLIRNLSVNSCVETLILSDRHDAVNLKMSVLEYIINNIEEVMETKAWAELAKSNSIMVNEVLRHHVKKCTLK